jgi:hypothetical protein
MANARSGNSHYVDSTGTLSSDACKIAGVIVTATAANAILALQDAAGSVNKTNLRVATSGDTVFFNFAASPIFCPNGLKASTVTNAIVTIIYTQ